MAKEHALLELLAKNAGKIVTIDILYETLWGSNHLIIDCKMPMWYYLIALKSHRFCAVRHVTGTQEVIKLRLKKANSKPAFESKQPFPLRLFAFILSCVLSLSITDSSALAVSIPISENERPFTNTAASASYPILEKQKHIAYLSGDTGGTVRPDDNITRAEVSAIFLKLIVDKEKESPHSTSFPDVPAGAWFTPAVAYLESLNIISGNDDGRFRPDDPITRVEFTAIASKFGDLSTGEHPFNDVPSDHWGNSFIVDCFKKEWISGYPDGKFYPEKAIARAEAVSLINNMLERKIKKADLPKDANPFSDLNYEHWAYSTILEASSEHDYRRESDGYEKWINGEKPNPGDENSTGGKPDPGEESSGGEKLDPGDENSGGGKPDPGEESSGGEKPDPGEENSGGDEDLFPGRVFYISESDGDDSNDGSSKETPWKSLDRVSAEVFQPDDTILFRRGDIWTGRVELHGSGQEDARITVASYGTGDDRPVIHGTGEIDPDRHLYNDPIYSEFSGVVELFEGSYWTISQLEVTNNLPGESVNRVGIMAIDDCAHSGEFYATPSHGLIVKDCYVHDVVSDDANKYNGGIILMGNWNDVLIDNNHVKDVSVSGIRNVPWGPGSTMDPETNFYQNDFIISNNTLENIYGDCIVTCSVENVLMEYNYVNGFCNGSYLKNYAALWTWASKDVVIQYNEITGGGNPHEDGAPFDVDWYNINTLIQYNYTHENGNNVAMFTRYSKNSVFRHNISINDVKTPERSSFFYYEPEGSENAPLIYDNILYQADGMPSRSIFENFNNIFDLHIKFFNNTVVSAPQLRFSQDAFLSAGSIEGNVFIPKSILINSSTELKNGVLKNNNGFYDRDVLKLPEIKVGEAPTGIISYNHFDSKQLEALGDMFVNSNDIVPPVNMAKWETEQSALS